MPHPTTLPLLSQYPAVICDVWGVLHNGVQAFAPAVAVLQAYRAIGGRVILVSNAPRPARAVWPQIDGLYIPRAVADDFLTSGDLTHDWLKQHGSRPLHWIGAPKDETLFIGLQPNFVPIEQAEAILCTGPRDDSVETPEDYRTALENTAARGLHFYCANPDVMVERGTKRIYCAGAIAGLYAQLGGSVTYYGKPYAPIYEEALARLRRITGQNLQPKDVLAIGDSLATDILGAHQNGMDAIFVAGGLHGQDFGGADAFAAGHYGKLAPQVAQLEGCMKAKVWGLG